MIGIYTSPTNPAEVLNQQSEVEKCQNAVDQSVRVYRHRQEMILLWDHPQQITITGQYQLQ